MKRKKWWIACMLALLALLMTGTASAEDDIIFRNCPICGGTAQFVRVRYGGNYYIDNVPSHVGYYKCRLLHGDEIAYLDDNVPHSGGTATCAEQARCEVCGTPYGDFLPHDLEDKDAKAATCTEIGWNAYKACKNCDYNTQVNISALKHDLVLCGSQEPTCAVMGWKDYVCMRAGCNYSTRIDIDMLEHDIVEYEAKAPTCTEVGWDAYEACSNCDYTTCVEIPAFGHKDIATVTKPTCTRDGYTTHFCTVCQDTYVDQKTAAHGHWYGEWTPNAQEDTQTAECRRNGCGYKASVSCTFFDCKLASDDSALEEFRLCPVCGKVSEGTQWALVEHASATADRLPHGEVLVRTGMLADGNQLMIVGFEYAGQLTQAQSPIKVSLPAELLEGCTLRLVVADGTETELPFSVTDGLASFSLDFTDAQSPVQLIHILPA